MSSTPGSLHPSGLVATESVLVTLLLSVGCLCLLARSLRRRRPDFAFGPPLAVAFLLRIAAAALVQLTPLAVTLRGGDETIFLGQTATLNASGLFSSAMTNALVKDLYLWTFSLQERAFDAPQFVLRMTQVGISVAAVGLLLAAVYDLGGRRAAVYAQFFIVLEPATMFFASLIHKESLMYLAEALAVFGCTQVWVRKRVLVGWPAVLGALIATATRSYAGWFIALSVGLCFFHASLRPGWRYTREARLLTSALVVCAIAFLPLAWSATSHSSLQRLQNSQDANSSGGSNLALEQVDFSTRAGIITNLPTRIFDVVLRPFPWQLGDVSQGLGVIGEMSTLATLWFMLPAMWRYRRSLAARAGPLLYVGFFTLAGYALSTGNAGTGFRYRTHFLLIMIAITCVLRATRGQTEYQPSTPKQPSQSRRLVAATR